MLPEKELKKLCRGRIILADVLTSSGKACKEHFAVMIDSDEVIEDSETYFVAPISHNDSIDPTYLVPVPKRTGLTGNIICSWFPEVHELGIKAVKMQLTNAEMEQVEAMIKKYQIERKKP